MHPAGAEAAHVPAEALRQHEEVCRVDHREERGAQALDPLGLRHAEDGAADHLEREGAHALAYRKFVPDTPSGQLGSGNLSDHIAKRVHGRALKRGEKEFSLAHVLGPVQDEHRALAEDGAERRVGLPGFETRLIPGEETPDLVGVGDINPGPEDEKTRGEDVAVAGVPAKQRVEWPAHEPHRLDPCGRSRTRRKSHAGSLCGPRSVLKA